MAGGTLAMARSPNIMTDRHVHDQGRSQHVAKSLSSTHLINFISYYDLPSLYPSFRIRYCSFTSHLLLLCW
jgi:hypothetical protein